MPAWTAWPLLLASAVLEAVWATALAESQGFTRLLPSAVFLLASLASMGGLGLATRRIPITVAYSVWTGTGAALTVGWAMFTGAEAASVLKVLFLAGIVACVIGLKLVPVPEQPLVPADALTEHPEHPEQPAADAADPAERAQPGNERSSKRSSPTAR